MKIYIKVRAIETNSPEKINALLDRCNTYGIDEIVYYIGRGPVMCKSDYLGSQLKDFDPLEYLLNHKGNLKVIAWWGLGRITHTWAGTTLAFLHSDWDTANLGGPFPNTFHWLDWRNPEIPDFIERFIEELLTNYPLLDGVSLDSFYYGLWANSGKEAKDVYGLGLETYLKNCAMSAKKATGDRTLALHVFPDYYGKYTGQYWDILLDEGIPDRVFVSAYFNDNLTYGLTQKTLEGCLLSWNDTYKKSIVPFVSVINITSGNETLKDTEDFNDQFQLIADFPEVGIFDNRATQEMLHIVCEEKMKVLERLETLLAELNQNILTLGNLKIESEKMKAELESIIEVLRGMDEEADKLGAILS